MMLNAKLAYVNDAQSGSNGAKFGSKMTTATNKKLTTITSHSVTATRIRQRKPAETYRRRLVNQSSSVSIMFGRFAFSWISQARKQRAIRIHRHCYGALPMVSE